MRYFLVILKEKLLVKLFLKKIVLKKKNALKLENGTLDVKNIMLMYQGHRVLMKLKILLKL